MKDLNLSSKLHIGTSGWSYKHWMELFYPKGTRPEKYLEYYMTQFSCVELNSSFYHLPNNATVSGWMRRTNKSFLFCPKMSRIITHQLRLKNIEEPLGRFFNIFEGLKSKMGPVLVQLPPGLRFDEPSVNDFFEHVKVYNGYRFAVEVRHSSWITDAFLNLLEKNKFAFVIADSGKRFPHYEAVTTDFVYLRFHGSGQLYASDYSEQELKQYAEKIKGWLSEGKECWVFFNNDFGGYAIKNALQLIQFIN